LKEAVERSDKKNIKDLDKGKTSEGHKEKFKSGYIFAGNNALKMQVDLTTTDIEYWNQTLDTFAFNIYPKLFL
jgi:hypothetical protein